MQASPKREDDGVVWGLGLSVRALKSATRSVEVRHRNTFEGLGCRAQLEPMNPGNPVEV